MLLNSTLSCALRKDPDPFKPPHVTLMCISYQFHKHSPITWGGRRSPALSQHKSVCPCRALLPENIDCQAEVDLVSAIFAPKRPLIQS